MLTAILAGGVLAATAVEPLNPNALDLFENDRVLHAWALKSFDLNADGWLTLFEAQAALRTFKEVADADGDGRVSVREFEEAKAFVVARWGAIAAERGDR